MERQNRSFPLGFNRERSEGPIEIGWSRQRRSSMCFRPIPALTSRHHCFKVGAMSLIRGLFWLVLFIFFTFSFVVLFEYGTHDFTNGFKQEAERVKKFCVDMVSKPKASPSPGAKKK
ncbi:MAG: hypothetical protein DME38_08470 [Verrucomicrobia bacterium]|nr:MAG: hypothetical protein DME38_08470 [Verrucomicrobiota bacterium]